eukprot:COSAG01_NODE_28077_length_669_cov_10.975439_1_plen_78_part_10
MHTSRNHAHRALSTALGINNKRSFRGGILSQCICVHSARGGLVGREAEAAPGAVIRAAAYGDGALQEADRNQLLGSRR